MSTQTYKRLALAGSLLAVTVLIGCRKPDAGLHARRGTEFYDKAKYPEAIVEFRASLQANAKLGDVHLKLGDTYVKVGDGKNALREYARAADLLPDNITAQIKAGSLLLLARSFEDAKSRADRAIALDPKNTDAQILKGNVLAGLKDLDGAMSEYQETIAQDPTQITAYANLGRLQYTGGKKEEAEATFKKAVEAAPKSVDARLALANFYRATNRPAECEEALKGALQVDPGNAVANRALGLFYLASGRRPEAEPFFQTLAQTLKTDAASTMLGDYYLAIKSLDKARKIFTEIGTHDEGSAVATTRLAVIDAAEGHRAQALDRLREILTKHPKDSQALLLTARLLLADGKRDEALAAAKATIAIEPNAPAAGVAHLIAGQIYAATDNTKDAIEAFEQVLKIQPRPLVANMALARLHLAAGSTDKSLTYIRQALEIEPGSPDARALLVRIDVRRGDMEKAKEDLALLQKAYPDAPAVHNLEALLQLGARQPDAARASYAKALKLDTNDAEASEGLLHLDVASGHAKEATARLDARLATGQPTAGALILAARTYSSAGETAKAEAALRKAVEVDPAKLRAYAMLGQLYLSQKRLGEAEQSFREVIRRNPGSVSAGTMLGMLLQQQGRTPEAEKEYQRVLAIDGRSAVSANNLASIYLDANRSLDEALQLAQTAQQQLVQEPHVADTLGWIYYKKNMLSPAIQHLESSAQKMPNDPTVLYHLGMAYKQSGDWNKARVALKQALTINPAFDGAGEAKKTLAVIGA